MRRVGAALLGLVLWASAASAATITVDNLWEYPATSLLLWGNDVSVEAFSPADPLDGFTTRVLELPPAFDNGFVYGELLIGGTCPQACGWASHGEAWRGDWIADGDVIDVLWPTVTGGWGAIARVTYAAGPSRVSSSGPATAPIGPVATGAIPTPEPATWVLVGVGLLAMRAWRISR